MKAKQFLFALLLCGCAALTSCEKTPDEPTPTDGIDRSLAGSMLVSHAIMDADITYEGNTVHVIEGDIVDCFMGSDKVSDTEQSVEYFLHWEVLREGVFNADIKIPALPLIGEPYMEAMFYHTCTDATVKFNDTEYTNVSAKVKGWIRKVSTESPEEYTAWVNNHNDFRGPGYTCDIEVECTIAGKVLSFHITELY